MTEATATRAISLAAAAAGDPLAAADTFVRRHIGPSDAEVAEMLRALGLDTLEELAEAVVPAAIRSRKPLKLAGLEGVLGEHDALARLRRIAEQNIVHRSFIGMGYHGTITPPVIQRNILENPGWYTQYTPYQAEISQGRLEALINFQTMVADLTGLPLAGASLLDEATAAAEAMAMCHAIKEDRPAFFVADHCHPQTIAVVRTRAESMGVELRVGPSEQLDLTAGDICGMLVQYPTTDGAILDFDELTQRVHDSGALLVVAADILALALIKPPGEFASGGADIAVGSTQRFGVPMGFGGPHAGYLATRPEFARKMPGRLVGISKDAQGNHAYRLAIQTREQHIRRDRATSNICTAQVLLAIMAGMYAVYHGPEGIRAIARRVHAAAATLAAALRKAGHEVMHERFFDTLRVKPRGGVGNVLESAAAERMNLRDFGDGTLGINLDETITREELAALLQVFDAGTELDAAAHRTSKIENRTSAFLQHPVFNSYHSETEMLRYIKKLESRDLSLTHSMIPLGSCTMKLNATAEMFPVTWPQFAHMHPFAPSEQTKGYQDLFRGLESWLAEITGFAAVSLQPNAGSQGEYAGLLTIRAYHASRGEGHRDICLIPASAHGTNPATAVIAGYKVVPVACDQHGNIDLADLQARAAEHAENLAALMITYPSTHGVFEPNVRDCIKAVHERGGQVYMDGANMNAQVGLTSPGEIGADVCHLNLHKTFCIPHGGGGPGMGPIAVAKHLAPFLPGHPFSPQDSGRRNQDSSPAGAVSAAPYGSAMILPISWVYIALMGAPGLKRATEVAILNANYIAKRLEGHYEVVYRGLDHRGTPHGNAVPAPAFQPGLPRESEASGSRGVAPVAHECIIDCRSFQKSAGVSVEDIAKRLMDFGFHAPTMSFPVAGTLMIEPTESESKAELDRFCDALIAIRREIRLVEDGTLDRTDNPLHGAPHTAAAATDDNWPHRYSRRLAAYPAPWVAQHKFWPAVGRIDNPYGDRNLMCTCDPDWQS